MEENPQVPRTSPSRQPRARRREQVLLDGGAVRRGDAVFLFGVRGVPVLFDVVLEQHGGGLRARVRARAAGLGIWNPATNQATTPGAPSVRRPYGELLPWWQARAQAIDTFRERRAADPESVIDAQDGEAIGQAGNGPAREVEVFCQIDRIFEEDNGDRTILFRATDKSRALRARIPSSLRAAHEALELDSRREAFHQNYLYLKGTLTPGPRGFEIISRSPDQWRPAGPEPAPDLEIFPSGSTSK